MKIEGRKSIDMEQEHVGSREIADSLDLLRGGSLALASLAALASTSRLAAASRGRLALGGEELGVDAASGCGCECQHDDLQKANKRERARPRTDLGRTPPWEMTTWPRSLFSSSSFLMASWR